MVGSRIVNYLKPVGQRNLPRSQLFIEYLNLKVEDGIKRANHITPNSNGVRLLSEIIKLADLDILLLKDDPYKKTGMGLLPILKDLEKMIDVRTGRHTAQSLFIKSKTLCLELMTASRRYTPLLDIPFDLPYDNPQWSLIKPFRISDMGTSDLKFDIQTGYLHYTSHGPTHVVYSLDCLALVAKFIAYYKYHSPVRDLDQCILDYLHKDVVTPSLLKDSTAIWLRNVYKSQLMLSSPLEQLTSTMWDNITIDTLGSTFNGAMSEILTLKRDLINQSITATTALNSLLVGMNKESFSAYYKDLYYTTLIPEQQQFFWVECIKQIQWWEFIVLITSYVPDQPDALSLQRNVGRDIRLWLLTKPWQSIHGSVPLKNIVQNKLNGLHDFLKHRV